MYSRDEKQKKKFVVLFLQIEVMIPFEERLVLLVCKNEPWNYSLSPLYF